MTDTEQWRAVPGKATQYYGEKAIYCLTPTTKEAALERVKPWTPYTPAAPQLGAGVENGADEEELRDEANG
jgi:hypothetical protein